MGNNCFWAIMQGLKSFFCENKESKTLWISWNLFMEKWLWISIENYARTCCIIHLREQSKPRWLSLFDLRLIKSNWAKVYWEGRQMFWWCVLYCRRSVWNSKMSLDLKGLKFVLHSRSLSEEDDRQPFDNFAGKAMFWCWTNKRSSSVCFSRQSVP